MIENHKLANLLVKFEDKIDCFLKDCNTDSSIAKDVKELIQEKLKILKKFK
ncbi:MAG: hypothetical protein ABFQ64_10050 [Campylobacterota bacterium]